MSSTSLLRSTSGIISIESDWITCLQKNIDARTPEDVEIVISQLKTLKVFENYPDNLLYDIALYSVYEAVPPHTTLFCPGDEGLFWYTVISGNLEMLQGDLDTNKVNSVCSLGEGSSFGESVIFGNKRETMIVTTDHCQLLCVEANHIKHIYTSHTESMKHLIHSRGRPFSLSDLGSNTNNSIPSPDCTDGVDEPQMSTPVFSVPESDMTLAGLTLLQIVNEHFNDLICDHQINLYTYHKCSSGKKLVDWVISQSLVSRSRQQVVSMWQALLCEGIIEHVLNDHQFYDDDNIFYRFVDRDIPDSAKLLIRPTSPGNESKLKLTANRESVTDSPEMSRSSTFASISSSGVENSPGSSPRSSISSLLEECFELISQLGPETLIYSTILKDPKERNEDDLQLIYEELLHVKAFGHLSNAIKEELAAVVRLENHPVAGKFLFKEGDPSTSWYVILKGSVNLIMGKGITCTLKEGDDFGKLALLNNAPRSTSIQLREPHCCFLRIDSDDFRRILLSVEKNTVKLKEHGKEVLLLEKSTGGKYLVVKGMPHKMLEYMLTEDINPGVRDRDTDEAFARDFFLTYPAFMDMSNLCDYLIKFYDNKAPPVPPSLHRSSSITSEADVSAIIATEEQLISRRKRVVWAVNIWVFMAKSEIVKDPIFQKLLQHLQDCLPKDGLTDQLDNLNLSLMDSIKRTSFQEASKGGGGISSLLSFPLKKATNAEIKIELGMCALPPAQPGDKTNLRVHTIDKKCCRLHVKLSASAKDIKDEACTKLELNPDGYQLCEVMSSGEKKVFKESDISIATEMTVNGRLYVLTLDAEKTIPPLLDQNQRPVVPFPESESSRELAAHLTSYDWNLFSNIQQMEFIYQVFGRHKFSKITSNLDHLIRRFSEIQFWTATEICKESNLQKRVKVIQKFIKIASHCKSFNNLNSFFAIVAGLMNGAVSRLKTTWEKVSIKLKRRFEQFEALMDPSRNHRVLRAYQSKLQPPVIPFMPLIVKDAFFLHEGNETFIEGLVNFEKMRIVASKVDNLSIYKKGTISLEIRTLSNKNQELQRYIRELKVIDNHQVLMQMSNSIEPPKTSRKASLS